MNEDAEVRSDSYRMLQSSKREISKHCKAPDTVSNGLREHWSNKREILSSIEDMKKKFGSIRNIT